MSESELPQLVECPDCYRYIPSDYGADNKPASYASLLEQLEAAEAVALYARFVPASLKFLTPEQLRTPNDDATVLLDCTAGDVRDLIDALEAYDARYPASEPEAS